jgi:hypothetical protein
MPANSDEGKAECNSALHHEDDFSGISDERKAECNSALRYEDDFSPIFNSLSLAATSEPWVPVFTLSSIKRMRPSFPM